MKKTNKPTSMTRLAIYFIVTVGLGLMELFRSKIQRGESWGIAAENMLAKMGLFILIFVVIEILYFVIRLVWRRRAKRKEEEESK